MENTIFYIKDTNGNYKPHKFIPIEEPRKKVAFVIGHYEANEGAYSEYLKFSEYTFWNEFYNSHLVDVGDKFIHPKISGYIERQKETAKKTKEYDLVFELYFNALEGTMAHGVEAFVYFSNKRMEHVGEFFCKAMELDMGLKDRNVKLTTSGSNGFGFLKKTKGDAILLEPFFGSNKDDCKLFNKDKFKSVIKKTIDFYYNN